MCAILLPPSSCLALQALPATVCAGVCVQHDQRVSGQQELSDGSRGLGWPVAAAGVCRRLTGLDVASDACSAAHIG